MGVTPRHDEVLRSVGLRFAEPALATDTHVNLSAVRSDGPVLWIAGDETATVERLVAAPDGGYHDHRTVRLAEVVALPGGPDDEVDIEGLARHGPYLWAVGSHSHRRKRIKDRHDDARALRRLAKVSPEPARHVLVRLAVAGDGTGAGAGAGPRIVAEHDGHTSAVLPGGVSPLLAGDEHLAPFLAIPGKDNGFDIEGVAVHGDSLFLGLRGPVLRGWAVVLEIRPVTGPEPGQLALGELPEGGFYRKYVLDLGGLGVRDLCPDGEDLLLLAGPSMDLDGPVRVLRWPGALREQVPLVVRREALTCEVALPYGEGDDHAEGIALLADRRLLVVYDSPAPWRLAEPGSVLADVVALS